MIKGAGARRRVAVARRKRSLLMSVSVLAGGLANYGRGAYAQEVCQPSGGSSYLCAGTSNDAQTIDTDNAEVRAGSSLIVEADPAKGGTGGTGITISGDGAVRFASPADAYTVVSGEQAGLLIRSTGDLGSIPGSVTVETSGYFAGRYGVDAVNYGSGATTIRFDGTAIGESVGISARNANSGNGGLFITAGSGTPVSRAPPRAFGRSTAAVGRQTSASTAMPMRAGAAPSPPATRLAAGI